ncbi:MAG: SDR family NAD(P)-dependent oxidoreductase [Acidobacteria bacterium]|nr:SDR family NAD(P)-dependent oxidoreductase [Acidobacteriota bacterium]
MPIQLSGKVALVTGASKGVGRGIALALARHGATVVVNYNSDEPGARETLSAIEAAGGRGLILQASVASAPQIDRMFDQITETYGRLDILVNNAGVQTWKALLDLTEADWDHVLDTNLKGTFLCTQRAAALMKNQGAGRILHIGSGCNKVAFPHLVNYTASKGGIEQFTKVAAVELGKFGITVNCVAPGAIEVERTKEEAGDYAGTWAAVTPLARVGTPEDVARAVLFFVSDLADFVTGQTLYVDGGLFAKPHWPYPV